MRCFILKIKNGSGLKCRISMDYMGQNPILPPTWGLFMADGEMYEFDGAYYMYGSRDYPFAISLEG